MVQRTKDQIGYFSFINTKGLALCSFLKLTHIHFTEEQTEAKKGKGLGLNHTEWQGQNWNPALLASDKGLSLPQCCPGLLLSLTGPGKTKLPP